MKREFNTELDGTEMDVYEDITMQLSKAMDLLTLMEYAHEHADSEMEPSVMYTATSEVREKVEGAKEKIEQQFDRIKKYLPKGG